MSGIVFFATEQHDEVVEFYTDLVGADLRLEQPDCTILGFGSFQFAFCARDRTDDCGILTFVYDSIESVDRVYERLEGVAIEEPHHNEKYDIYQFFAEDPDGRTAEFQVFLDEEPDSDPSRDGCSDSDSDSGFGSGSGSSIH